MTSTTLIRLALAAVALHVTAAGFLFPPAGTSPLDHLASGFVPLAVLAAAAVLAPRLPAAARAAASATLGAVALTLGIPAVHAALEGESSPADATGILSIAAGAVLLGASSVVLWRSRRTGGSRRRRWLRRSASAVVGAGAAFLLLLWVVAPVGFSYGYTHLGRTGPPPDLGVAHERVTVTTSDGLELEAAYIPSRNRAAVVVFPGRSAVAEALMLARNGYGVLLLDPRGQGGSEGGVVRWAGDRDLHAGAAYLQGRPDVDDARIGGFGSSVGGEILVEAAAQSTAFKAIVSEGAGLRAGEGADLATGPARILVAPALAMVTAATTVFSDHRPPPPLAERIGRIAPRPVFLIYADPGMGGEAERQASYYAAAGEPKSIWRVPGAEHTGGIDARPEEFERRVVAFYDRALLGAKRSR